MFDSNKNMLTQCLLIKYNNGAKHSLVTWVEAKKARVGDFVRIKDSQSLSGLWSIEEAWATVEKEKIEKIQSAVKHHRDQTDV